MWFRVVGPVQSVEAVAIGRSIRELTRLRKAYGGQRWRKLKGIAMVELPNGPVAPAEVHWHGVHGIGRCDDGDRTTTGVNIARQYRYALCVKNRGYVAALEVRKVYRLIPDRVAEGRGLVRVVDESGQDYLYPAGFFLLIELPRSAMKVFSKKSA